MSTLSQFIGTDRVPTQIVNQPTQTTVANTAAYANAVTTASGAMTANTLKTALSVTGRGQINYLALWRAIATNKTLRCRITLDGTVALNFTDAASAASNIGYIAIGAPAPSAGMTFQPVKFRSSLLVEIASSITETDGIAVAYNYEVH